MTSLFRMISRMSITAGYVIVAVVVLRLFMRRLPRRYSYFLWSAVLFRLCCPFSFSSVFSIFNLSAKKGDDVIIDLTSVPLMPQAASESIGNTIELGSPAVSEAVSEAVRAAMPLRVPDGPAVQTFTPQTAAEAAAVQTKTVDIMSVLSIIWIAGAVVLIIYATISYLRLRKKVKFSALMYGNVRQADIESPFVLGLLRPTIYMPFEIDKQSFEMSLMHEKYHIKRKDNWVRALSYVLLCLHWMNPLCWAAYFLMIRDMEMSCDEYVLSCRKDIRETYSRALLKLAVGKRRRLADPVTFGSPSVKDRIRNAMKYKRRGKLTSLIAALLCALILVSCAFNGKIPVAPDPVEPGGQESGEEQTFEPVRQIGKPVGTIIGSPAKTSHGYYEIGMWNNPDYANIVYTDYATRQTIFLCNVPGCAHNTPDCTSYVAEGNSCTLFTDYSEKHLYLIFSGREANEWHEGAPATITEMNMDGSGRRTVCVLPADEHFSSNYMYVAGDDYVYLTIEHPGKMMVKMWDFEMQSEVEVEVTKWLQTIEKIWFKDGKTEKIRDLRSDGDVYEGFAGVVAEKYLLINRWDYQGGSGAGSKVMIDQSGETVETAAMQEPYVAGECVYVAEDLRINLEKDGSTATAVMELTGSGETKMIKDIPYTSNAGVPSLYRGDGYRFYMQYIWTENDRDHERAFILDFEGETWKEFDLRQKTNSHYFVTPIADAGSDYLVIIDRRDTTINLVDKDGVPRAYDYYGHDTYALISKEDFWNSVPDYRLIEDKVA